MTEDPQLQPHEARHALTAAGHAAGPAAAAARRAVRNTFLVMGLATSAAVLFSGVISHWGGAGMVWPRALATGALWGVLFGAALALLNSQPVRALPARWPAVTVIAASVFVIAATMGIGRDVVAAYPIGAVVTFVVWALGALWVWR
jgi:hypothetical protein